MMLTTVLNCFEEVFQSVSVSICLDVFQGPQGKTGSPGPPGIPGGRVSHLSPECFCISGAHGKFMRPKLGLLLLPVSFCSVRSFLNNF